MDQVSTTEPAATASTPDPPAAALVDRAAINTEIRCNCETYQPASSAILDRSAD